MSDESQIKIMQSLGLNYKPAIDATKEFENTIGSLDKRLSDLQAKAIQDAKDINNAFSSQLGNKKAKDIFTQLQKESKPIEVKVVTDQAEKAMIDFARSMGIRLNKEMKEHFSGLADSMLGDFDQSKFDKLAKDIGDAYYEAQKKYQNKLDKEGFTQTDEHKVYDYLRNSTLKLDDTTIGAKKNVDGFSEAIRNLTKQSKDSGMSLDQMAQELEGMGVSLKTNKGALDESAVSTEDIAGAITRAVKHVRDFRQGFSDIGNDLPETEIRSFVENELMKLTTTLGQIKFDSKEASEELSKVGNVSLDKSVDSSALQKAHEEALKMNKVYDDTLKKNHQLAKDSAWKQQFQGVADTSNELSKMKEHYLELEKYGKANIRNIKESNLESMKSKAASIQQRATAKELGQEYVQQAGTLREELSVIQNILQTKGKLTAEEVLRTQELKEQLDILDAQSKADTRDRSRLDYLDEEGQKVDELGDKFVANASKFYAWVRASKEATETIKDVEMGIVEVARVMTDSSFVFEDYRDNLLQLGVDYGQTFDNVQNIALRWAQSGYNVADSLELTETSLLALNTAELDGKQATESMIGIMAQWQLQAEDLALVMDKVNLTADRNAITSKDLVDGLLRSSSAARNMNMTLDETIGLLTVMREASGRAGSEVGNALNSILSYITRPKSIETLEDMGIKMFTDETESQFRNALEIFRDISTSWGSLSKEIQDGFVQSADDAGLFNEELATAIGMQEEWNDVQQRDVSQASAGVYRRNYFIGMIERMTEVQGVLNDMTDAGGYSMEENAKTMETLEKKQASLKTSVEALAVAMGDAGLADTLKSVSVGGAGAIDMFLGMPKPAKDAVMAFTQVTLAVKALETGIGLLRLNTPIASAGLKVFSGGITNLTTNVMGLGTAIKTGLVANLPLLGTAAVIGGAVALRNHFKKLREEVEETIEVFKQQKEASSAIDELLPKYEELASKTGLTTDESQELLEIKERIKSLLPEVATVIDDENMSLEEQIGIIEQLNEKELERAKIKAGETLATYSKDEDGIKADLEANERAYANYMEIYNGYLKMQAEGIELSREEERNMKTLAHSMEILRDSMDGNEAKLEAINSAREFLDSALKDNTNSTDENTSAIDDNTEASSANADVSSEMSEEMKKKVEAFNDVTSTLQFYNAVLDEANSKDGITAATKQEIINSYHELLPYMDDEAAMRLYLIDIIQAEEEAQREAYFNMIKDNEAFFNAKIKGNADLVNKLNEYYGVEISNAKDLASAKAKIEDQLIRELSRAWGNYFKATADGISASSELIGQLVTTGNAHLLPNLDKQIGEANRRLKAFSNIVYTGVGVDFSGLNLSKGSGSKGSTSKKPSSKKSSPKKSSSRNEKEEYKAEADAYAQINQAIDKQNNLLKENGIRQDAVKDNAEELLKLKKEEIKIEEELQRLSKQKADMYRADRKALESKLSKQGFKFSGKGDDRIITNLSNVAGKSKEVEEMVKLYTELGNKTIPGLVHEQMEFTNSIRDSRKEISELTAEMQASLIKEKDDAYKEMQEIVKHQIDMFEGWDNKGVLSSSRELLKIEEDRNKNFKDGIKSIEGQMKGLSKQSDLWKALNELLKEFNSELRESELSIKNMAEDIVGKEMDVALKFALDYDGYNKYLKDKMDLLADGDLEGRVDYADSLVKSKQRHIEALVRESQKMDMSIKGDMSKAEEEERWKAVEQLGDMIAQERRELKNLIGEQYEYEFSLMDKKLQKFKDSQNIIDYNMGMADEDDFDTQLKLMKAKIQYEKEYGYGLQQNASYWKEQLSGLKVGSYEWEIVNNKVEDYNQQIRDSNLAIKQMHEQLKQVAKDGFKSNFDKSLEDIERQLFGGGTEDEARRQLDREQRERNKYVDGAEKELEVSKILAMVEREKLNLTQEQIDLLNAKGKIERESLERMEKELEIQRLQIKLDNLREQKTIRQFKEQADGTFDFEYVVDDKAIEQAEEDLRNSKLDLIKWEKDQDFNKRKEDLDAKSRYLDDLRRLSEKALEGEYESVSEFYSKVQELTGYFHDELGESINISIGSIIEDFTNFQSALEELESTLKDYELDDFPLLDMVGDSSIIGEAQDVVNELLGIQDKAIKDQYESFEEFVSDMDKAGERLISGYRDMWGEMGSIQLQSHRKEKSLYLKAIDTYTLYVESIRDKSFDLQDVIEDASKNISKTIADMTKSINGMVEKTKIAANEALESARSASNSMMSAINSAEAASRAAARAAESASGAAGSILDMAKGRNGSMPSPASLKTGGYTGDFHGDKLAILHEKELVLNETDTENVLDVVGFTRDLVKDMDSLKMGLPSIPDLLKNTPTTRDLVANISIPDIGKQIGRQIAKQVESIKEGFSGPPATTIHNYIDKVVFPDITDGKEAKEAIMDLPRVTVQYG